LFQTEVFRNVIDFNRLENLQPTLTFNFFDESSINWILSKYYYRLSDLAQTLNLRIGLIGGHSDSIFIDKFESEYPGLFVACQSLVNFCINDSHRIEQPTFQLEWPHKIFESLKKACKNNAALEYLLLQEDLSKKRIQTLGNHPNWFPDRIHAGRLGHKKLYQLLKDQKYV